MTTLHLIFNQAGLNACLRVRAVDEPVILMGNAVYHHAQTEGLKALHEDCALRGVTTADVVTREELVDLTVAHCPIVSWAN
ncbi:MAG: hypothetical protein RJQ07_05070 [Pseudomonadales bacterium]